MDWRLYVDLVFASAAIGVTLIALSLRSGRRADRTLIGEMQRAFESPQRMLPGISVGSTVLSASPRTTLGGDLIDVWDLDRRYAMLLVADVSGKGVEAAVDTAFIKYTIRTLALEGDGDPAVILTKFNAIYTRTILNYESFVVLILGIIDTHTGQLRYASAGHEPAYVRRNGRATLLPPTGPIVGVSPYSVYASKTIHLNERDVLVWTTDGMTESRDRGGQLLGADGLAQWIADASGSATAIVQHLMRALHGRRCGRYKDDVAVLVVAFDPEPARMRTGDPCPQSTGHATRV